MTQRERIREERPASHVGVYDANQPTSYSHTTDVVNMRPTDLVRWGPVVAGLFAALATLISLSVLGLAIGLSNYNYGDPLSNFGIGAGVWGAITALLSFFVGGWLAGRTAAFSGSTSGVLNGAMVWFVTIPLLIYLLGSGIGSLVQTVGSVAGTAAGTAAGAAAPALGEAAGALTGDPAAQATAQANAEQFGQAAQATAQALQSQVTPGQVNETTENVATAAWSTLLSMGLAAGAAILGGYLGGKPRDTIVTTAAV